MSELERRDSKMNRQRILIVEDDKETTELTAEFLQAKNYLVDTATNGVECIKKFKESKFDMIILDVRMPNLDGHTTCKMIRNTSNIPIIFLTALADESDQIRGFDLGCDDYITKPFSFNLLLKRVEAVLRRSHNENKNTELNFEEISLDLNTYSLKVKDAVVELTLKEFNILKELIEKYPQVITRETLLDSIWGYDYYGDSRIVDAHIKNIRKKIGLPYIKTVKGIGYTLDKIDGNHE